MLCRAEYPAPTSSFFKELGLTLIHSRTISLTKVTSISSQTSNDFSKINLFIDENYKPFLKDLKIYQRNLVVSPQKNYYDFLKITDFSNLSSDFLFTDKHLVEYLIRKYKLSDTTLPGLKIPPKFQKQFNSFIFDLSLLLDVFSHFRLFHPKPGSQDVYPSAYNLYVCAENTHERFNLPYSKMISTELSHNSLTKLANVVELFNRTVIFTLCLFFSETLLPQENTSSLLHDLMDSLREKNTSQRPVSTPTLVEETPVVATFVEELNIPDITMPSEIPIPKIMESIIMMLL